MEPISATVIIRRNSKFPICNMRHNHDTTSIKIRLDIVPINDYVVKEVIRVVYVVCSCGIEGIFNN